MAANRIVVLDAATLGFKEAEWAPLEELGELVRHDSTPDDAEEIVRRCAGASIVLTNKVPMREGTLERLPELKLISVLATGYNIVDTKAARTRNVTVCNVPAYSNSSVVQHTLALLLELCNHVGLHSQSVHQGEWVRSKLFCYWKKPVRELYGRKVGIVGYGSIGAAVGEVMHALGADVLGFSPSRSRTPGWESGFAWAEVGEIFERCDVVSLHCPQTPDNTGFVNAELLGRMKVGALLVNTARGGLVVEEDLAHALRNGPLAGAAIDVVDGEPMRPGHPLLGLDNCMITPHIAWTSRDARERLLEITAGNVESFINGGVPQNTVN